MARATTATMPSARDAKPQYDVRLLGAFSVSCEGVALDVDAWPRRGRSLLRLLATTPQRRRFRDEVIDTLWPEATPEAGFANLRTVLHRIHRRMDPRLPAPMVLSPGWVLLNPECHWAIDLDRFEELAKIAGDDVRLLEMAADLTTGEPLAEDRYEDWASPVRERIWRQWRAICLHLARLHRIWGSRDQAVTWFELVLDRDPLDEEAMQGLVGALGEAGRGSEALRRYQQFAHRLKDELDVAPAAETLSLVANLRAGLEHETGEPARTSLAAVPVPVVPSYPLPVAEKMVGQGAARERLRQALSCLDSDARRSPQLVFVVGEAGMGKTRLLAETARQAGDAEMLVLAGGCYEQEGRLPYGPVHDALLDYARAEPEAALRSLLSDLPDLVRLLPEVRDRLPGVPESAGGDVEGQRLRLFSTVAQFLDRVMSDRPLVLLLDDLQWADESTLQLLHYLLRQTRLRRLLLVGACRAEEVQPGTLLEELVGGVDEHERIDLQPLTASDLARLVTDQLGGGGDERLIRTVHERSDGNPFFALQMLRLLRDEGGIRRDEDVWRLAPGARLELPTAVREIIKRRLRRVGVTEREVLTLGAVLGREFPYPALEVLWEGTERSLFAALDSAHAVHLVGETEEGYAFAHPLLWEVVYSGVPAPRLAILHERAGLALERVYGNRASEHTVELARHFTSAGPSELGRAVRYLVLAGDQAERVYAHAEAEGAYRAALQRVRSLADPSPEREVLTKLGAVLTTLGRLDEALRTYDEALALVAADDQIERSHLHVAMAGALERAQEYDEALRQCEAAQAALGEPPDEPNPEWSQTWLDIQLQRMGAYYWTGRPEEMLDLARRIRPVVEQRGAPAQRARFLASLILARMSRDRFVIADDVLADARAELAAWQELGDQWAIAEGFFRLGFCLLWRGELDEAEECLRTALQIGTRVGDVVREAGALTYLAVVMRKRGRAEDVRAYATRGRTRAADASFPAWIGTADANLAWVAWREGDLTRAEEQARAALHRWKQLPIPYDPFFWTALWPLLGVALARGETADAVEQARALLAPTRQPMPEELASSLRHAIAADDEGRVQVATGHLRVANKLAAERGYL